MQVIHTDSDESKIVELEWGDLRAIRVVDSQILNSTF